MVTVKGKDWEQKAKVSSDDAKGKADLLKADTKVKVMFDDRGGGDVRVKSIETVNLLGIQPSGRVISIAPPNLYSPGRGASDIAARVCSLTEFLGAPQVASELTKDRINTSRSSM